MPPILWKAAHFHTKMDQSTSEFYDRYAGGGMQNEAAKSAVSAHFGRAFRAGGKVLDVGAGSARDLVVLLGMGFDAYGLEPNDTMRATALRKHAELAGRLQAGALPALDIPFGGGFDGILCSAVLMHVPSSDLPRCAESFRALLNPKGRLLLSLPFMRADLLDGKRDPDGRFFENHGMTDVARDLEQAGFALVESRDGGEYAGTRWFILLFALSAR